MATSSPLLVLQVRQLCGSPSMVAATKVNSASKLSPTAAALQTGTENVMPMDSEMIQFLVTIENSQEFYSSIVNR